MRPQPSESEVYAAIESCSNEGRWGPDDERGTLNLITADLRVEAARLVRTGKVVPLALTLTNRPPKGGPHAFVHRMLYSHHEGALSAQDVVEFAPHGFQVTHYDAVGHVYMDGTVYNGRRAADTVTAEGITFGSVMAARDGIFARGVLLDVAAARGTPYLAAGEFVEPEDLEAAEIVADVRLRSGDAVLVRVGLGAREVVEGPEDTSLRAGLAPSCIAWLRERDVAVFGGDCVERLPSTYPAIPLPFHSAALARMGLAIIDNLDMEALATMARQEGRYEFLLVCSPLPISGGTGSPVNPLAVF